MTCEKDHTLEVTREVLEALPESQKVPGRHRCTACAYLEGALYGYLKAVEEIEAHPQASANLKEHLADLKLHAIKEAL